MSQPTTIPTKMKTSSKNWRDVFKTNYDFYDKDLVNFVRWHIRRSYRGEKDPVAKELLDALEPELVNFGHNLAVFLAQCNGEFSRIGELKTTEPDKPIVEKL